MTLHRSYLNSAGSFFAFADFELDLLAFFQSSAIYFGMVDEKVIATFLLDETKSFLLVEPLYFS